MSASEAAGSGARITPPVEDGIGRLEQRLGRLHARQRIGIEQDHEARAGRQARNFFDHQHWYLSPAVVRAALKLSGLYWRAQRNARNVQVRRNELVLPGLPPAFDGFAILQISDLHIDLSAAAIERLIELLPGLGYDICVLTGDYRGKTFGPCAATLAGMGRLRPHLEGPVYGVLGNHDSIRMVPALEDMGIRMLVNEAEPLSRGDSRIHLAGIDDAHFYRMDNIEKAASRIPDGEFSILLSHTPEIYRQAAHAGFGLLLSGHTHGGQICLPGAVPVTLDAALPRQMGAGPWRCHQMAGYTSVGVGACIVAARINCLPEIALHRLRRG